MTTSPVILERGQAKFGADMSKTKLSTAEEDNMQNNKINNMQIIYWLVIGPFQIEVIFIKLEPIADVSIGHFNTAAFKTRKKDSDKDNV